jgi:hypothetical protein
MENVTIPNNEFTTLLQQQQQSESKTTKLEGRRFSLERRRLEMEQMLTTKSLSPKVDQMPLQIDELFLQVQIDHFQEIQTLP